MLNSTEAALVNAWWRVFRNQRLIVKNVILTALEGKDATGDLRHALLLVAPSDYPGVISAHKLGRWLARIGGQRLETYVFIDHGKGDGGRTWQLLPLANLDDEVGVSDDADGLPEGFLDAVAG